MQQPISDMGKKELYVLCQALYITNRQVKEVQKMMIILIKVQWERDMIHEETYETKTQMKINYSELFWMVLDSRLRI